MPKLGHIDKQMLTLAFASKAAHQRTCRICGCTDADACVNADGETCHWVGPDLCSACGEPESTLAWGEAFQELL